MIVPARRKIGVLIVNVGTPDAPRPREVRRYLRQFLMDPRVLDINPVGRFLLVELGILLRRPRASAEAYAKVWTPGGSPLRVATEAFTRGLQEALGPGYDVAYAMRYGRPSIEAAIEGLRERGAGCIIVFPQFPQYASSSTGTALAEVFRVCAGLWNVPDVSVIPPFWDEPGYAAAFAAVGRPVLDELAAEHVLFSFHGLPERHVLKSDATGSHCLASPDCCAAVGDPNRNCYRAQCLATARLIAAELGLSADGWSASFQSRLGRTPWIKPYTDHVIPELAARGIKRLAVFCPAFVADCLETLEEIGLRARDQFLEHGGEALRLVPSLNAHASWVGLGARLCRKAATAPT